MKTKLLAAACMLAVGSLASASNVTLYGAVDEYVGVNNLDGKWKAALKSGGATASHWGIKGEEDLGNGVQVFFNLDQAFLADNGGTTLGSDGKAWSREANLGIRGKYGQFSFGRQYTPHFLTFAMYDPTELSLGSSDSGYFFPGASAVTGYDGALVRADNSFMYVTPPLAGLTSFFYISLGEHTVGGSQDSNTKGNIYNYAAKYDLGSFSAMASYLWRSVAPNDVTENTRGHNQYLNMAVSYDFNVTKPVIQFTKKWTSDRVVDPLTGRRRNDDFWMLQVGTSTPVFGGKWMISGSYMRNQSTHDANAWGFGTKYAYPLSKRTRIYCGVEAIWNGDNAGYAVEAGPDSSAHFNLGGNSYGTTYLGKNTQELFVGLNHQF